MGDFQEAQRLEGFLEGALRPLRPTPAQQGFRVVVDPNSETTLDESDGSGLADEMRRFLEEQTPAFPASISPQGYDVQIPEGYPLLSKYLRKITLYNGLTTDQCVQVAPSGGAHQRGPLGASQGS